MLHQITDIKITRDSKVTDARSNLKIHLTTEAIILDGAEPRAALFPVTSTIAAIAGLPGLQAVAAKPELVRKLTTTTDAPILATRNRDYSWLAQNDMFYGQIPPPIIVPPVPLGIARVDPVMMDRDEKPKDIRVRITGDGSATAKIAATISGSLLPEGALTIDPKTHTITIPAIDTSASDYATSTVNIVATATDGKTAKGSFSVSVRPLEKPPLGPAIDSAIRLVIVSTANDGTAEAMIKDNANPFRYMISATAKGIDITKWWQATGKSWKRDRDYDQPQGVLLISDEETATKRTFKVVAIEHNAVIVSEEVWPEPAKSDRPAMGGKGFGRQGGFPARQGHADPLGAVASNLATMIPKPVYYRWSNGKSLKDILDPKHGGKLKPEEIKIILDRVTAHGPVPPTTLTAAGNE